MVDASRIRFSVFAVYSLRLMCHLFFLGWVFFFFVFLFQQSRNHSFLSKSGAFCSLGASFTSLRSITFNVLQLIFSLRWIPLACICGFLRWSNNPFVDEFTNFCYILQKFRLCFPRSVFLRDRDGVVQMFSESDDGVWDHMQSMVFAQLGHGC